ncbi:MAG: ABC transporter permease [Proteobacteria bacterium]|jgi:ABC-2 type transport system permease protein|nr:ABC transporter permease [Pseudomonadota bacterium]
MISLRRTLAIARKELRHIFRDHRMRPVIFILPVIQLIVLGFAANMDVQDVGIAVVDHDHSPASRDIIRRVDASSAFVVSLVTDNEREGSSALDDGRAELVLLVPAGLGRGLARGEAVDVPVWIDGTDTNRGLLAQGFLEAILGTVSAERLPQAPPRAQTIGFPQLRIRVLFNPALQSRWFMVPAVVVLVLAVITMLLSAMAIVKERENGTIEQLVVTPVRPLELVLGKLGPFVVIGLIIATLVTFAAVFVFKVPMLGNPLHLLAMAFLFLFSTLGLGLFASTVSATQQQAMMAAILVLLPSFLLGGVFYPISNLPNWAQILADFTPIRYFIVIVRSVFLKGAGLDVLWWESSMLGLIGVVVLLFAVLRFRKRSD